MQVTLKDAIKLKYLKKILILKYLNLIGNDCFEISLKKILNESYTLPEHAVE